MFGLNKKRTKFGKFIDRYGIKQRSVADRSKVSESCISQLASDQERVPTLKNAKRIIKTLKRYDSSVTLDDFWDIEV